MSKEQKKNPYSIVFGFDRETDERSLKFFLERFTDKKIMNILLPRLQDEDIAGLVDFLTRIMHKHLSEKEYHRFFLAE